MGNSILDILYITSFIYVSLLETVTGKIRPGVWMDDGYGRTVKAEMGPGEAELLKQDMLHALGLPPPPRHRHHRHHTTGSAPMFLKNIYESLDERGHVHPPNLDPLHRATVAAADTIITFVNRGN